MVRCEGFDETDHKLLEFWRRVEELETLRKIVWCGRAVALQTEVGEAGEDVGWPRHEVSDAEKAEGWRVTSE